MDDLRSQLLKAGLVSEEQVRKAEKGKFKDRRTGRSTKEISRSQREAEQRRAELEEAKHSDRERQRRKHEERERKVRAKAERERRLEVAAEEARAIIKSSAIALDQEAPVRYNFAPSGRAVKSIQVTPEQQRQLGAGELGIVRPHANLEQLVLLPRDAALRLRECAADKLELLHDLDEEPDEFDGLMW